MCEHEGKQIPSGATPTTRERDGERESQIKNENCVLVTHFHDVFPSFPPDVPVNDILNTFRLFQEISLSGGEKMFLVSINFKLASSSERRKKSRNLFRKGLAFITRNCVGLDSFKMNLSVDVEQLLGTDRSRENTKQRSGSYQSN